jgi:hypothetical protein
MGKGVADRGVANVLGEMPGRVNESRCGCLISPQVGYLWNQRASNYVDYLEGQKRGVTGDGFREAAAETVQ